MARFLVEIEGDGGESEKREIDGLAVARALARNMSRQGSHAVVVRDGASGKVVARYEPPGQKGKEAPTVDKEAPTLANSVQRMRAANDRLKEALVPSSPGRKKGA